MNALISHRRLLAVLAALSLLLLAGAVTAGTGSSRGYLGVMLQDISPSMAKALQLEDHAGVLVSDVVDGSPAEKAGLEDGDVILEFNGKTIDGASDLTEMVRSFEPGAKAKLLVLRDGKQEKIKVEIGAKEDDEDIEMEFDHPDFHFWKSRDFDSHHLKNLMGMVHEDRGYLGAEITDLTEQLGDYFGIKEGEGVLVTSVQKDSPAAKSGLQAGDVIIKIDDQDTPSSDDLMDIMGKTKPDDSIAMAVMRKGKQKSFKITLAEMPADENILIHRGMKGSPRIKVLRQEFDDQEFDDQELDHLHQELDQLREELDQLRQEFEQRK